MLSILTKVIMALVIIASGAAVGTVASGAAGHLAQASTLSSNMTSAEQAAVAYIDQHYAGNGTTKILKIENDTENGTAVVDVTVLAPNNNTYSVEVSLSTNAVLSVELVSHGDNSSSTSEDSGDNNQTDDQQSGDGQSNDNQSNDQTSNSDNSTKSSSTGTDN